MGARMPSAKEEILAGLHALTAIHPQKTRKTVASFCYGVENTETAEPTSGGAPIDITIQQR